MRIYEIGPPGSIYRRSGNIEESACELFHLRTRGKDRGGRRFCRLPFTAVDGNATSTLASYNYGGPLLNGNGAFVFANYLGGAPSSCSSSAVTTPCFTSSEFSPATSGFGAQRRNQFYGPNFFDTDFTVMKDFSIPRWEGAKIGVGLQFFNLFNHPNFDQPVGDIANPQFGSILQTVSVPTSIVGSFLGGDASPRMIQVKAHLTF